MYRSVPVLLTLVLLTGCERSSTSPETVAFLHATVSGAFSADHRGGATFGGATRSDTERIRMINSYYLGAGSWVSLRLLRSFPGSFEPGVYPLSPRNFDEGHNDGNTGIFMRPKSDLYIAETGTLTITDVSEDRVSGHFDFTAVYWCNATTDRDPCYALPDEFSPEAPRIVVRGRFAAEPPQRPTWP